MFVCRIQAVPVFFWGPTPDCGRVTRDALDSIARHYLKEAELKLSDRPQVERYWNFPLAAVEEAVENAVYHRSYEIREPLMYVSPQMTCWY